MLLKYRKFFTSTVGFSFLVVSVTGIIFKFFFKTHTLEEIHGWLGVVMVASALFHIIQNWPSLRKYLREPRVLALLIPIGILIVVLALQPAEPKGVNPRAIVRKLADGKLKDVAQAFNQNSNFVLTTMSQAGLRVTGPDQTLSSIAQENQKPPEALLGYFMGPEKP